MQADFVFRSSRKFRRWFDQAMADIVETHVSRVEARYGLPKAKRPWEMKRPQRRVRQNVARGQDSGRRSIDREAVNSRRRREE